jgi:cobalamin 5'-phosphate synthase/cobalamin synthase
LTAVAFLSRLPVPLDFDAADVGRASLFFPLIGAALGALSVGAAHLLRMTSLPPLVQAALLVALGALATGALHFDGLADSADGFGGGRTREDVLRIMRDHAIGAYGALALVLLVVLKVGAIAALLPLPQATAALVVAPTLARWGAVAQAKFLPAARADGLGAALADHVGWLELTGASGIGLAIAFLLLEPRAAAACVGAVVAWNLTAGALARRRIGGVTGDTLGASCEIGEALILTLVLGI